MGKWLLVSSMKIRKIIGWALLCFALSPWAAPVNINKADEKALADNLKNIGPAKAKAIIEYRKNHGPFKTVEDLLMVKGVGPKTLDINRQDIRLKD
jgi:competence protein ComEA